MASEEIELALKRVADSQVARAERMEAIDRKLQQVADSQIVQRVTGGPAEHPKTI